MMAMAGGEDRRPGFQPKFELKKQAGLTFYLPHLSSTASCKWGYVPRSNPQLPLLLDAQRKVCLVCPSLGLLKTPLSL